MPYKDSKKQREAVKEASQRYRARKKAKIAELKRLASRPVTLMTGVELAEKIKEL